MKFRTSPFVWAALAAIIVNIVIFDLIVIATNDPGLGDLIVAGVLGMTSAVIVLVVANRLFGRRSG